MNGKHLTLYFRIKWPWLLALFLVLGCSSASQTRIEGKPGHHVVGGFRNYPLVSDPPPMKSFFYLRRFWTSFVLPDVPEGHILPEEDAIRRYVQLKEQNTITWLGQSTFLIKMEDMTILTDPYLTTYASSFWGIGPKRFSSPGISIDNLPEIDVIVVSHNHLDHLDAATVEGIKNKEKIQVYVPLGLKSFFIERGYKKVEELDWWERRKLGSLTVTSLPTVHQSGRSLGDKNETLWCSWSITSASYNLYFLGDSGYSPTIFKEIGEQYGPFNMALLTIGAYETRKGNPVTHLYPEDAVKVGTELNAKTIVGMHWGTLQLSDEPPFEPPVRFSEAAQKAGFNNEDTWIMKIGETRSLLDSQIFTTNR